MTERQVSAGVSTREWALAGSAGRLFAKAWAHESIAPGYLAVLVHGYGEHIGRYEYPAASLARAGGTVYGLDHMGHGRSAGERVLITDLADVVTDLHRLVTQARTAYPELPLVLVGHSLGGLIATSYAQRRPEEPAALALSGPVLGRWSVAETLLQHEEIPDTPIDPEVLSRDPAVGAAYAADELVWHGPFKRPTLQAIVTELARVNEAGSLGDLPLLWLHGSDDRLVPLSGTRVGIETVAGTDVTVRIFPGARHEILNETNRDEVLGELHRFAARTVA